MGACQARSGEGSPPGQGRGLPRSRFQALRDEGALEDQENIADAAVVAVPDARKQVGCLHTCPPRHPVCPP